MKKGKFQIMKYLNKKTLKAMISEVFSTDVDENQHIIKNLREEYDL